MLKQRVITAIVLLALLIPALLHENPVWFGILVLALLSAGAWEWARLCGLRSPTALATGLGYAVALWAAWSVTGAQFPVVFWLAATVLWMVCAPWLLRLGLSGWGSVPQALRLWGGLVAVAVAWAATVEAKAHGVAFLLSVFGLVWVADVAAYFGGKTWGRHKLAPTVSPGKTWEGALCGWLGVMVLAAAWIAWDRHHQPAVRSVFSVIHGQHPFLSWAMFTLLSAASVVGDLIESLVKRSAGFKDSSRLLPGHGGVLDRVDALLPVLPMAMLFIHL